MWAMQCSMLTKLSLVLATSVAVQTAFAVVMWDDTVNGDLSNNRLAPTALNIGIGSNTVRARTQGSDREYFKFTIAQGQELYDMWHTEYISQDFTMFLAVQRGATFTETASNPNPNNLLGYSHIGDSTYDISIFNMMGAAPGATGFSGPLQAGTYTFWAQQQGSVSTWTMDFRVRAVPEPATLSVLGVGFAALIRRKKRTSK